jgi:hypothetical protein
MAEFGPWHQLETRVYDANTGDAWSGEDDVLRITGLDA